MQLLQYYTVWNTINLNDKQRFLRLDTAKIAGRGAGNHFRDHTDSFHYPTSNAGKDVWIEASPGRLVNPVCAANLFRQISADDIRWNNWGNQGEQL
jgi:hypothetical protein